MSERMSDSSDPLSACVRQIIDIMATHATTDDSAEMYKRLLAAGFAPDVAQIVPDFLEEYCGHLVTNKLGVRFLETYTRPTRDGNGQVTYRFSDHPAWRCIHSIVPDMIARGEWHSKLGPIAMRSAVLNSIDTAIRAGSKVEGASSATAFLNPDDEITSIDVTRWLPRKDSSWMSRWLGWH